MGRALKAVLLLVGMGMIFVAFSQQVQAQKGKDVIDPATELFRSNIGTSYSRLMQWLNDGRLDPNMVLDSNRGTFMHYASTNYLDILRTAVEKGGKCNLKDANGATPLHFSAAQQPLGPGPDAIRLLVKCGADPNLRDRRGATPLHALYISVRKAGVIRNLNPASGGTLAELQAGGKRQDVLQALLAAGADPDIKDNDGNTPLMLLIKDEGVVFTVMGHLRLLLKHGANPNTRDKGGTTPLIVVVGSDHNSTNWNDERTVPIITALLKGGARPNLRDGRGDTPLIHAAKHKDDIVSETKALLAGGADPCLADRKGRLPIDHAGKDSPIGRLLFKAGGYRDPATGACAGAAVKNKPAPTPLCSGRTGQGCWLEVSNRAECYRWISNPRQNETFTWSGRCIDGKPSGSGKAVWRFYKDGAWKTSSYEGEYRDGRRHGRGTFFRFNGDRYEGEFRGDKPNGRGTFFWSSSGNRYEGEFRDSRMHGRGTLFWPDGDRYEGEWRDNRKHGRGTFWSSSGNRYEGEWRDDKPYGPAVLFRKSGRIMEGVNGCFGKRGSGPWHVIGTTPEACGFR